MLKNGFVPLARAPGTARLAVVYVLRLPAGKNNLNLKPPPKRSFKVR